MDLNITLNDGADTDTHPGMKTRGLVISPALRSNHLVTC